MRAKSSKQRCPVLYVKFYVKLGKTATKTLKMLYDVYGDSSMSRTRFFELHK